MDDSDARARDLAQALLARHRGASSPDLCAEPVAPPSDDTDPLVAEEYETWLDPPIDYPRAQRFMSWYGDLLRAHRIAGKVMAVDDFREVRDTAAHEPADDADSQLLAAIEQAHRLLLEHPMAARALFQALCAEGHHFAETPAGRQIERRLRASPTIRRGALLWRSLTMGMLDEDTDREFPSTYLDNLLRAAGKDDLESLLGRLLRGGRG